VNHPILYAVLATVAAAVFGALGHHVGRKVRRPSPDLGDQWARSVSFVCLALGVPVLVSGVSQMHKGWWDSNIHLQADIRSQEYFIYMLLGPVAAWAIALLLFSLAKSDRPQRFRWLAGAIGFGERGRGWVLFCGIPFVILMLFGLGDLGGGTSAYPAAAWSTMLVLVVSLVGLAASGGAMPPKEASAVDPVQEAPPAPAGAKWPESMTQHGFQLHRLWSWPATSRPVDQEELHDSNLRPELRALADRGLSYLLVNAANRLLTATRQEERSVWVRGPDHCGQLELVATLTESLARRHQQTTLIVTSRGARELADRLGLALSSSVEIFVCEEGKELDLEKQLWVVDANQMSDRLLPELSTRHQAADIGLVVWWDLQEYSGIYAANMWAISRRLQRIMTKWGRLDAATVAFSRKTLYGHGQAQDFIARLLPVTFAQENVVDLYMDRLRPVNLYRLEKHQAFFKVQEGAAARINPQFAHPALLLGLTSAESGWRTALDLPADLPQEAINYFRGLPVGHKQFREALAPSPAEASVSVTFTDEADILSIIERVGQGGRKTPAGTPHHVAVIPPINPYAAWLLERLSRTGGSPRPLPGTRRLIGAESNPELIKRHLLKALAERQDTHGRLLKTFMMREEEMHSTLAQLAREDRLKQDQVRYLDSQDRMQIDHRYRSLLSSRELATSLDSVGLDLVEVREAAGGALQEGVRMRVDPERLAIQAYPGRIFFADGVRYRVRGWEDLDAILERGWVSCVKEGTESKTWRNRRSSIWDAEPQGQPNQAMRRGVYISRQAFEVEYRETVHGSTRLTWDLVTGKCREDQRETDPIKVRFDTRGVLINLPQSVDEVGIISLCECLRIVLPVHLGLDHEAVELVPVFDETFGSVDVHGFFIIDLYPGGIGIVDAFQDDDDLWLNLLEYAHKWLAACPCQEEKGCPSCLHWKPSIATQGDGAHTRRAALELLEQVAPLKEQEA